MVSVQGQTNLDTSRIALISLDHTQNWSWHLKNHTPTTLTNNEIKCVDSLINVCISEHNNNGKGVAVIGKDIGNHTFKRQIVAGINPNGDIVVWVNCFSDDERNKWDDGIDWRKEIVKINDGGASGGLFNLMINLTQKRYYNLYVNGI